MSGEVLEGTNNAPVSIRVADWMTSPETCYPPESHMAYNPSCKHALRGRGTGAIGGGGGGKHAGGKTEVVVQREPQGQSGSTQRWSWRGMRRGSLSHRK